MARNLQFRIEIAGNRQTIDAINQLDRELLAVTNTQRKLRKLLKDPDLGAKEYDRLAKQLSDVGLEAKNLRKQKSDLTRELQTNQKAIRESGTSYSALSAQTNRLRAQLRNLDGGFDETNQEARQLKNQIRQNTDQLKKFDKELGDNFRNVGNYSDSIQEAYQQLRQKEGQLKQVSAEIRKMNLQLKTTDKNSRVYKELQTKIRLAERDQERLTRETRVYNQELGRTDGRVRNLGGSFRRMITQAGLLFGAGIGLNELTRGLVDLDEALADVRKTTGLTNDEVEQLREEFETFDTRTAVNGLLSIAQGLGRLGVAREEIAETTRVVDQLVVALGDDLGGTPDEIATAVGKIVSLFGEDEGGLANGLNKVGSAINFVAQNTRATAGPVLDFTARLAGIAPQIGLTVDQVISLGTVLDANGQAVERSATSVQRLLLEMGKAPATFARFAGVTKSEFSQVLRDDAFGALQLVLRGVKTTEGGVEALAGVLEEIGIDSQRAAGVIGVLSNNVDDLGKIQLDTNKALEEGTSLAEEFALKNETLGAAASKLGKELLEAISGGNIRERLTQLIGGVERLIVFIRENRVAILAAVGGLIAYRSAVLASTIATRTFSGAIKANPIGLLVSGVTILATVLLPKFVKGFTRISEETDRLTEVTESAISTINKETASVDRLFDSLFKNIELGQDRQKAISDINKEYGEYLPNLLDEQASLEEINKAYESIVNNLKAKVLSQALEEELTKLYREQAEALGEVETKYGGVSETVVFAGKEYERTTSLADQTTRQFNTQVDETRQKFDAVAKSLGATIDLLFDFGKAEDEAAETAEEAAERRRKADEKAARERERLERDILEFANEAEQQRLENIENAQERELALLEFQREQKIKAAEREAQEILENEQITGPQRAKVEADLIAQKKQINRAYENDKLQLQRKFLEEELEARIQKEEKEAQIAIQQAERRRNDRLRELGILGKAEADLTESEARQRAQIQKDYEQEVFDATRERLEDTRQLLEEELGNLTASLGEGIAEGILSDEQVEKIKAQIEQIKTALSGLFAPRDDDEEGGRESILEQLGLDEEGQEILNESIDQVEQSLQAIAQIQRANTQKKLNEIDEEKNRQIQAIQASTASEEEKAARIQNLEAETEARKQEIRKEGAKKTQKIEIGLAIIKGAQAAIQALANTALPFPASLTALIPIALTTAAEIATIKSQQFAKGGMMKVPGGHFPSKGGIIKGRSHAQGGVSIGPGVEAEGGEWAHPLGGGKYAIINKRSTAHFKDDLYNLLNGMNTFNGWGRNLSGSSHMAGGGLLGPAYLPKAPGGIADDNVTKEVRNLRRDMNNWQRNLEVNFDTKKGKRAMDSRDRLVTLTEW